MPSSRGPLTIAVLLAAIAGVAARAQPASEASPMAIEIDSRDRAVRERAAFAAREAFASYSEWLGPRAIRTLAVTGVGWQSLPETMDVESLVAYSLARLWWTDAYGDTPLVNGIAWYLQSRVVERLYDLIFLRPGHSSDSIRLFGAAIGWPVPALRMSRWQAGLARSAWLHAANQSPFDGRRLPASLDQAALHAAIQIASIERSAGWPVVQAALRAGAMVREPGRELAAVLNDAAGLTMVRPGNAAADDDLAIAAVVETRCTTGECYRTRVSVARAGGAGGIAVPLRVDFGDGRHAEAIIGAGDQARELEFESTTPYATVWLDPERTILTDRNLLNNTRFRAPVSNVPVAKWLLRWLAWLENAMLSYSALL